MGKDTHIRNFVKALSACLSLTMVFLANISEQNMLVSNKY